jgi:hypothetical protein
VNGSHGYPSLGRRSFINEGFDVSSILIVLQKKSSADEMDGKQE